jgi:hypothetical protein
MNECSVAVFFYGLFMDESLIRSKGIQPSRTAFGYVDGYRLRIGTRATLEVEAAGRVYGVLMSFRREDLEKLYSDDTVADYVPEKVSVTLASGVDESAVCYLLPPGKLEGTNSQYAASLLQLATSLGFPGDYLAKIRMEGNPG